MSVLEINAVVDLLVTLWPNDTWTPVHDLLADWRERLDGKEQESGHRSARASEYAVHLDNTHDLPLDKLTAVRVAGHDYGVDNVNVAEHVVGKADPAQIAE